MHSKLHHGTTVASPASRRARCCTPNGIRTRVTALKGRRPRPLDDGGSCREGSVTLSAGPGAFANASASTVTAISFSDPAGTPAVPDHAATSEPDGSSPAPDSGVPLRDRLLGAGVVLALLAILAVTVGWRAQRDDSPDSAAAGPTPTTVAPGPSGSSTSTVPVPGAWPAEVQPLVTFVEQHRGGKFDHPVPITYLTRDAVRGRGPGRDAGHHPRGHDRPRERRGAAAVARSGRPPTSTSRAPPSSSTAVEPSPSTTPRPTRSRSWAPSSTSPTGSRWCTSSPTPGRTSTTSSTSSMTSRTPRPPRCRPSPRATPCASRTSTSTPSRRATATPSTGSPSSRGPRSTSAVCPRR